MSYTDLSRKIRKDSRVDGLINHSQSIEGRLNGLSGSVEECFKDLQDLDRDLEEAAQKLRTDLKNTELDIHAKFQALDLYVGTWSKTQQLALDAVEVDLNNQHLDLDTAKKTMRTQLLLLREMILALPPPPDLTDILADITLAALDRDALEARITGLELTPPLRTWWVEAAAAGALIVSWLIFLSIF